MTSIDMMFAEDLLVAYKEKCEIQEEIIKTLIGVIAVFDPAEAKRLEELLKA